MVAQWIRLCGGLLSVRVRGAEPERFLNLCAQERIALRRIERVDIDELRAELSVRDFRRLARVKKRKRCRVHITRRRGLPFVLRRLRRRYALWGGLLLLCLVCYELGTRVWVIETEFPPGVDGYAVMAELDRLGIGIGTRSADIDAHAVKVHMMTALDELKFFAVNVDGNTLSVQTAAATEPPEVDQNRGVRSVVALRDGVIDKMIVRRGTAKCKPGDAVLAGDLLVDALVEPQDEQQRELGSARLVDANADVWASTRRAVTRKLALEAQQKRATGASRTRYAICFGKTRINLYFGSSLTQGNCDRIISIETVRLNDHFVLPVSLYREVTVPYTAQTVVHTADEAQGRLEYGARRAVEAQLEGGSVSAMQAEVSEQDGAAVLHAVLWCYEQIAVSVEDGRTQADLPDGTDGAEQS